MEKMLLVILVGTRHGSAVKVQKLLTEWGCFIKTRLGIHDGVLNVCSDTGLIILEMVGAKKKIKDLAAKLNRLPRVRTKLVALSLGR